MSCHGCMHHRNGNCWWFSPAKEIPDDIMDKGCKFQAPITEKIESSSISQYIINLFNGEIIREYEPILNHKERSWTKGYKSKHKYSKRADW